MQRCFVLFRLFLQIATLFFSLWVRSSVGNPITCWWVTCSDVRRGRDRKIYRQESRPMRNWGICLQKGYKLVARCLRQNIFFWIQDDRVSRVFLKLSGIFCFLFNFKEASTWTILCKFITYFFVLFKIFF